MYIYNMYYMWRLGTYIITWRGLVTLLILVWGQCEGLRSGMSEKLDSPMPF